MRSLKFVLFSFISFACFACFGSTGNPDYGMEDFPSHYLKRKVPISLHVPASDVLAAWKAANPNVRGRLILFLPGLNSNDLCRGSMAAPCQLNPLHSKCSNP